MAEDLQVSRGGDDPKATLKAYIEAQLGAATEEAAMAELAQAPQAPGPSRWEVYAWGPYQLPFDPANNPGRIIFLGEKAYIGVAVWLNPAACQDITGFEAKIELSFWTSNTQTMRPVPSMDYTCCIETHPGGPCFYVTVWEFEPTEAACVMETNICARICNCNNHPVPGYAGFVRHVFDFDPENLFAPPPPGWGFDRPIRYLVSDGSDCDCSVICP
jgi:hypothetical protein